PKPSTRLSTLTPEELSSVAAKRGAEPAKLSRLVRGDLDWIVMKALEKDRTRRYETANGFADDLRRHLDNEVVLARPPSTAYRMKKAWRRNKVWLSAATVVLAALVLGVILTTWQAVRATQAEALRLCPEVFGPEHPKTLMAMTNLAISLGAAGRLAEAIELQQQALAIKRRVLPPKHPELVLALKHMAQLYDQVERTAEARTLYQQLAELQVKFAPAQQSAAEQSILDKLRVKAAE
ncbi:MAG: tetratricopeptide repeat protein, partial [Akkermansiaceae bacterium]|nr:tetratricopeptide repeat protein [Akkermansiaceae bacterium]MCF7734472.1 tetratricopeptide repeat protein [Akkermansiaceae bacterium]